MADLSEGPFTATASGDHISLKPPRFGPAGALLIAKGMILTPCYGETAFTALASGPFLRRAMPVGDAAPEQGD